MKVQSYSFFPNFSNPARYSVFSYLILCPYLCRKLQFMNYISNLTELINAFRAETRQDAITPDTLGSLLQRMVETLRKAWGAALHPFYHIECDTKSGRLIVKHPTDLMEKGYVPYLLRYSKKKPRYRDYESRTRSRGPLMRGWHLFHDEKKIQLADNGVVSVGRNTGTPKNPVWVYEEDCGNLFENVRVVTNADPDEFIDGVCFKVGFGSRTYRINTYHRFRFGIVFGPPITENGNRSLKLTFPSAVELCFSECVTNIAEFYVNFHRRSAREEGEQPYKISYSI